MSENLKKKTSLWLLSQKIQDYLKDKPFSLEEKLNKIPQFKKRTEISTKEFPILEPKKRKEISKSPVNQEEKKDIPTSWLELPLYQKKPQGLIEVLILVGKLERENFISKKTLSPEEEEDINKWMRAIEMENFAVKRFPWSENNLSLKYPQIEGWFYKTLKEIKPRVIFILGEENISLITGYPVILEFIHGVEFTLNVKDISTPIIASYSPKNISFNSKLKRSVWNDLKRLKGLLMSSL